MLFNKLPERNRVRYQEGGSGNRDQRGLKPISRVTFPRFSKSLRIVSVKNSGAG